jgi:hypothetical protein
MYPAGLDRALTVTFEACEKLWVAYVRPMDETPGASRVLAAAPIEASGKSLGGEILVDDARRFLSLSFAPAPDASRKPRAGWLAWSADGNAWARAIRCQ